MLMYIILLECVGVLSPIMFWFSIFADRAAVRDEEIGSQQFSGSVNRSASARYPVFNFYILYSDFAKTIVSSQTARQRLKFDKSDTRLVSSEPGSK